MGRTIILRSVVIVVFSLFSTISYFFGRNDLYAIFLIAILSIIMLPVFRRVQMSGRMMLISHFNSKSTISAHLQKQGLLSIIISLIASILFAIGVVLILKGITLTYGIAITMGIIFLVSLSLSWLVIGGDFFDRNIKISIDRAVKKNLNKQLADHTLYFSRIVISAVVLNIILAAIFTSADTSQFLSNQINYSNDFINAKNNAIEPHDKNQYTRVFINAYIILDNFRIATANEIITAIVSRPNWDEMFFFVFYHYIYV